MNTINQQGVTVAKDVHTPAQPASVVAPSSESSSLTLRDKLADKLEGKQANDVSLQSAVTKMNEHVQSLQRNLQFSVDDESGLSVVTVMDRETEEVIRQIPSEEMLALARRFAADSDEGAILFSSQA